MTTPSRPAATTAFEIEQLEARRCRSLEAADLEALADLLDADLVHVHANGQVEDREDYLRTVRERYRFLSVRRSDLVVKAHGDIAIAVGRLDQTIHVVATGAEVTVAFVTTQVWLRRAGIWRQASFHATPLQAP